MLFLTAPKFLNVDEIKFFKTENLKIRKNIQKLKRSKTK